MPNIEGLVIPAQLDQPITKLTLERGNIRAYQRVVGGNFDVIDLEEPASSLFFNDEGKLTGLPHNPRATMLLWLHNRAFFARDLVQGDCLLLGIPDAQGNTHSVPEHFQRLLLQARGYQVQVRTGELPDGWSIDTLRITNWEEAYSYAISLFLEHKEVTDVRVVPIL